MWSAMILGLTVSVRNYEALKLLQRWKRMNMPMNHQRRAVRSGLHRRRRTLVPPPVETDGDAGGEARAKREAQPRRQSVLGGGDSLLLPAPYQDALQVQPGHGDREGGREEGWAVPAVAAGCGESKRDVGKRKAESEEEEKKKKTSLSFSGGDTLNALKNSMSDPKNVLESWNTTVPSCTWIHVTCNNKYSVIRVDLGNANLSGELVSELGQLPNLQYLELYSNNITGKIPDELGNLTNLVSLDLSLNNITGPIPDNLANLKNLRFLRLNNNSLSGSIPMRLTTLASLQMLDLSNNNLTGDVPVNGSFSFFDPISFKNNPLLNQTTPTPPPAPTPQQHPSGSDNRAIGSIVGGVFVGAALLFVALVNALFYWKRRKPEDEFFDVADEDDPPGYLEIKRFSLRELQIATDDFSNILGRGGFGKVYRGRLTNNELIAVKRLKRTEAGRMQFLIEVEMIGLAVHYNLLRLRGFCMTSTQYFLVYPFMVNGNVVSCLRDRPISQPPLEWSIRKRIALEVAKGLSYMHDHCDPKVIHRDVKADNIFLDENFKAVLGGFRFVTLMDYKDTHDTAASLCGTFGHIPPEYFLTGEISEKTDVFGYGVMLLEIIAGQRAYDLARLADHDGLGFLDWVKVLLKDKRLEKLADADLEKFFEKGEVEELIQVALLCTQSSPLERPKMSEVVRMLKSEALGRLADEFRASPTNVQTSTVRCRKQPTPSPCHAARTLMF
ncbi:hypothetical protein Fmac_005061 [Flemingia macrophylla]|uniref:non-specific serine/threonine protein kinase n=1 Tax=Flemingia macrophylla TaxID=520843 RepID=A0ABD1N6R6_9FABA